MSPSSHSHCAPKSPVIDRHRRSIGYRSMVTLDQRRVYESDG